MRILIDARQSGTSTGRYIDKLIEHLHGLKPEFEIIVLSKTERKQFFKDTAPSFKFVACDIKEFSFAEQLALKKQIEHLAPDLVHFGMTQQPLLYKGKTITTIHDLTTARFVNPSKNFAVFKFKQVIYRRVIKIVAKKSNKILAISNYVKDDLVNFSNIDPSKVTVTLEAADKITETAEPIKNLTSKVFISYVGKPLPHKNLPRLIEAFQIMRSQNPMLYLALVGKTDSIYREIAKSVNSKGINNVIFTGFISEAQLKWLYQNTAAYVFPSLSEGFGLPGVEAMVHGAPVAASTATCLPEIYGEAALYFDPENTQEMAAQITKIVDNKALSQSLVEKGYKQAAKYSWDKTAKQTLEVYRQILS